MGTALSAHSGTGKKMCNTHYNYLLLLGASG